MICTTERICITFNRKRGDPIEHAQEPSMFFRRHLACPHRRRCGVPLGNHRDARTFRELLALVKHNDAAMNFAM